MLNFRVWGGLKLHEEKSYKFLESSFLSAFPLMIQMIESMANGYTINKSMLDLRKFYLEICHNIFMSIRSSYAKTSF